MFALIFKANSARDRAILRKVARKLRRVPAERPLTVLERQIPEGAGSFALSGSLRNAKVLQRAHVQPCKGAALLPYIKVGAQSYGLGAALRSAGHAVGAGQRECHIQSFRDVSSISYLIW